jgi:hypothetical protein
MMLKCHIADRLNFIFAVVASIYMHLFQVISVYQVSDIKNNIIIIIINWLIDDDNNNIDNILVYTINIPR